MSLSPSLFIYLFLFTVHTQISKKHPPEIGWREKGEKEVGFHIFSEDIKQKVSLLCSDEKAFPSAILDDPNS